MAERRVVVTRDGPYRVEGDVPLLRTAIVETEYGEPVDWDEGPAFRSREGMELCRCGGSSRKPFCDGTHEREPFDGTETADRRPSADRRLAFTGDGVVMTDDMPLCTHAGFCGDRFTKVWMMIDETSDPQVRERLKDMVSKCPSGRLVYQVPPAPEDVEPVFEPSIGVEPNGPLWVRGGVPVVSEDGTPHEVRNRVTLCRCGRSRNKPFCDGTHRRIGFSDPAEPR
jgi:CDGSH-type Zn-finger protein